MRRLTDESPGFALNRLRWVLYALVCGLLVAAILFVGWLTRRDELRARAQSNSNMATLSRMLAEHFGRELDALADTLDNLHEDILFQRCFLRKDRICLADILSDFELQNATLNSIALLDTQGQVLAYSKGPLPKPLNLADQAYFKKVIELRRPYLETDSQDLLGLGRVYPFAVPVWDVQGQLQGIFLAGINPMRMEHFIAGFAESEGAQVYLFREDGQVILSQPGNAIQNMAQLGSFVDVFQRASNHLLDSGQEETLQNGLPAVMPWTRISGWDLALATQDLLQQPVQNARHSSQILIGLVLGASTLLLTLLAFLMSRLRKLAQVEEDLFLNQVVVEHSADMVIWFDAQAQIRYVNWTVCQKLGYVEEDLIGQPWTLIFAEAQAVDWPILWRELTFVGHAFQEWHLQVRDAAIFPAEASCSYIRFKKREYNCTVLHDISERKAAEEALVKSEQLLRFALEASHTGLFQQTGDETVTTLISPEYARLLGYAENELQESPQRFLAELHPDDQARIQKTYEAYQHDPQDTLILEYRRRLKSGEYHWFQTRGRFVRMTGHQGDVSMIGTLTDIHEYKVAAMRLAALALVDSVTGLPNRHRLMDELDNALRSAYRHEGAFLALLFLDLDRFKLVNDTMGHEAGDELLQQLAARLRERLGKKGLLARLGGDEFVVLLPTVRDPLSIGILANTLLHAFDQPFALQAGDFRTSTSIGISVYPVNGTDAPSLLKSADLAMYRSKAKGRNCFHYFSDDMTVQAQARLHLASEMHQALEQSLFSLRFQPQHDLNVGQIHCCEALLHWNDPRYGLHLPPDFWCVAEISQLILALGRWMLLNACQTAQSWPKSVVVALRVTQTQLAQERFAADLAEILEQCQFPAARLELVIPESVLLADYAAVLDNLNALRLMGVRLALGDFGVEYANLAHLRYFAFDKIQIEGQFLAEALRELDGTHLIAAITAVGHVFNCDVLAQNVDNALQIEVLQEAGVDCIQGPGFCMPLTATQIQAQLNV